ncbi:MAG: exo-alpha-sialidase [Clostridia bacterium]|nr:exo-alpha-sialidase [Clostridia bacterium]
MLVRDKNELKKYEHDDRIWQGIPSIEVTKKGRIFSTFYTGGTTEPQIYNYSLLVYSDDGKNFTEPVAVARDDDHRCYDPTVWIDPLGRLWFVWSIMPDNAVYAAICDDPDADEIVFGEEFRIGNDIMLNKPTVLSSGEWLFPIAVWNKGVAVGRLTDSWDDMRGSFVYRTTDNGKTFEKLGRSEVENRLYDEHMVLELNDKRLMMLVRTTYGIGISYSDDKGLTWSEGEDSKLGGPCSRFHITRLKSGRVLLVNHYNFKGRNNLYALLSDDDCKSWKYKLLIDERSNVSYPDAKEAEDGYIYITYDRERGAFYRSIDDVDGAAREILYAKITEDDIIAGELVSMESSLRNIISKLHVTNESYEKKKESLLPDGFVSAVGKDRSLYASMNHMKLLDNENIKYSDAREFAPCYPVTMPDEEFAFLHEAAVIVYKGTLFAAWYNNPAIELKGRTPIRFARSLDGGRSWTEPKIIADDMSGDILYCPPVFGIYEGKLYMLLNQMVAPDHMHALDTYIYDEDKDEFVMLTTKPIPFKLNTNTYEIGDGKLMICGRVAELDGFPITPAVMISDSGRVDTDWRTVTLQKDGYLPDGEKYVHPEPSAIINDGRIYVFTRNDLRRITTVYTSDDNGESWSEPYALDIPFSNSKIYSGTLSDGRNYIIGNLQPDRRKLVMYVSEKGSMRFNKCITLNDGLNTDLGFGEVWHYPCAYESDGKLYIIYTVNMGKKADNPWHTRGAVLTVLDINEI